MDRSTRKLILSLIVLALIAGLVASLIQLLGDEPSVRPTSICDKEIVFGGDCPDQ
jgi:hypothetical protein